MSAHRSGQIFAVAHHRPPKKIPRMARQWKPSKRLGVGRRAPGKGVRKDNAARTSGCLVEAQGTAGHDQDHLVGHGGTD